MKIFPHSLRGPVVQLVRAPACHAGSCEFESRPDRQRGRGRRDTPRRFFLSLKPEMRSAAIGGVEEVIHPCREAVGNHCQSDRSAGPEVAAGEENPAPADVVRIEQESLLVGMAVQGETAGAPAETEPLSFEFQPSIVAVTERFIVGDSFCGAAGRAKTVFFGKRR